MSLLDEVRRGGYTSAPHVSDAQVQGWRDELVTRLTGHQPEWPGAPVGLSLDEARRRLDEFEERLRRVEVLAREFGGDPHLFNVREPLAELILIILSRKTPERAYLTAFERLLSTHDSWEEVRALSPERLESLVADGGLGGKKALAIFDALDRVHDACGEHSMEAARSWDDARLERFLTQISEVGPKSALCVMLYAFGRPTLPVDAHVGRVLMRLGLFELLGLELEGMNHKRKQRYLAPLAPPDLRYSLHVNLLVLGRDVCTARKPACSSCPLRALCRTGSAA